MGRHIFSGSGHHHLILLYVHTYTIYGCMHQSDRHLWHIEWGQIRCHGTKQGHYRWTGAPLWASCRSYASRSFQASVSHLLVTIDECLMRVWRDSQDWAQVRPISCRVLNIYIVRLGGIGWHPPVNEGRVLPWIRRHPDARVPFISPFPFRTLGTSPLGLVALLLQSFTRSSVCLSGSQPLGILPSSTIPPRSVSSVSPSLLCLASLVVAV
ncbi:hypothetical protein B0T13DRAFT_228942 [Neurospora crassa]|nr:hypothetical protein B0T13DRAFT_228942 [Neurospora crassa]